jgi:hypothetical protein
MLNYWFLSEAGEKNRQGKSDVSCVGPPMKPELISSESLILICVQTNQDRKKRWTQYVI